MILSDTAVGKVMRCFLLLLSTPALADVQVAFSPHQGATEAVVSVIQSAEHSVHVAAYGFSSRPIAQALIEAHRRGVDVDVVLDRSNASARWSETPEVAQAGIPVRIDYRYAIMHSKFIVADGKTVETGSMNYTRAGEFANEENVIVLRDMPDVAAAYERNWEMLWSESRDYGVGEAP